MRWKTTKSDRNENPEALRQQKSNLDLDLPNRFRFCKFKIQTQMNKKAASKIQSFTPITTKISPSDTDLKLKPKKKKTQILKKNYIKKNEIPRTRSQS